MFEAAKKVEDFAQERVAERKMERCQPGYVEKPKSMVEKAVEAAEEFIAKQDDDDCSSSSDSECETKEYSTYTKTSREIAGTGTRVEEEVTVSVRTTTEPEYPGVSTQNYGSSSYRHGDNYGAFNNDVSSSSEYRSTQVRNGDGYEQKEYTSSYSKTSRDDSDGYYGGASSSYSTRVDEEVSYSARPEYPSNVYNGSSYPSVVPQAGSYGAPPMESNAVSSTSEYRSTQIRDGDEYERKEYSSSYSRTSRDDSEGCYGGASSTCSARVDEEVDYSARTTRPEYMGGSGREYNSSSYQRTVREDDNCDAFNRMTLESSETEYRSTRARDDGDYGRNENSSYSRNTRDNSDYSTRVDEEVNVSVRTTSTPEYRNNSTQNYSSSSYRRDGDSYGDVSSSSEYRSTTRVRDADGCETEEYLSYSRTSRDDSNEYRRPTGNFGDEYSSRVEEEVSYSSRSKLTSRGYPSDECEFQGRPAGGVYGSRELQMSSNQSYGAYNYGV